MILDFDLCRHVDDSGKFYGYFITLHTEIAVKAVLKRFGIVAEINTTYRFMDVVLFQDILSFFEQIMQFSGIICDDSWPILAKKNKAYWEGIYGEGYIESQYPKSGNELWDSYEDLKIQPEPS